jgi:hypothetical protein
MAVSDDRRIIETHALCEVEMPTWWPHGSQSRALWSLEPRGDLAVFVHGFTGHAVTTWSRFNTLLRGRPETAGCDFVFFGYDGLRVRAPVSAGHLLEFLRELHARPSKLVNDTLGSRMRAPDFRFRRTFLLAHSLGAVICRSALLRSTVGPKPEPWAKQTELLLFAPAHAGAQALGLAGSLFQSLKLSAAFAVATHVLAPVLIDLQEGSSTLSELRRNTCKAIDQGHGHLAARSILHCERDGVVHPNDFSTADADPEFVGRSHSNICKPDDHYEEPIRTLMQVLS